MGIVKPRGKHPHPHRTPQHKKKTQIQHTQSYNDSRNHSTNVWRVDSESRCWHSSSSVVVLLLLSSLMLLLHPSLSSPPGHQSAGAISPATEARPLGHQKRKCLLGFNPPEEKACALENNRVSTPAHIRTHRHIPAQPPMRLYIYTTPQ